MTAYDRRARKSARIATLGEASAVPGWDAGEKLNLAAFQAHLMARYLM